MVHVRLEQDWTDGKGVNHSAGEQVDVDAATLARLQAEGVVGEGSTGNKRVDGEDWVGPGSTKP